MANIQSLPIAASFFGVSNNTQVTWLGMAGALINARGVVLLIDPLITTIESEGQTLSEAGYRMKIELPITAGDVPRADLVMYTHGDDDHIGLMTARTLAEQLHCQFFAPPPVSKMLMENGVPADLISLAHDYQTVNIGDTEIAVTPALHDWQEKDPWQRGDCCGYLVKTPDGAIWHPGDTRLIDELLIIKGVDVIFFDVADVNAHLGSAGSAKLAASSGAKVMIPYHYGTFDLPPGSFGSFDPDGALEHIKDLPARFLRLNPGEVFTLGQAD
jgi:L-ascorbate metabolism protein UlaG (beta-lactamase superfamily)